MANKKQKYRERDFTMDDTLLIQKSRTLRVHFLNYLSLFTALDNELDATFAASWLTSVEECEGTETDETVMDQLSQYSAELETAKKEGFTAANDLEYYVGKAFPENKRVMEEFGFTERKKARAAQFNQHMWMKVMKKIADDYQPELTTAGMPTSVLSILASKTTTLLEKETEQEYYKHLRIRYLRIRIEKMNRLYSYCTRVNRAAQVIFYNQVEERGLFTIY